MACLSFIRKHLVSDCVSHCQREEDMEDVYHMGMIVFAIYLVAFPMRWAWADIKNGGNEAARIARHEKYMQQNK